LEDITLRQVREFNVSLLKKNKKPQLYFWIGYLSYFKEKNLANALQDFENFEKYATNGMLELKQKSSVYLIDIKQKMDIEK